MWLFYSTSIMMYAQWSFGQFSTQFGVFSPWGEKTLFCYISVLSGFGKLSPCGTRVVCACINFFDTFSSKLTRALLLGRKRRRFVYLVMVCKKSVHLLQNPTQIVVSSRRVREILVESTDSSLRYRGRASGSCSSNSTWHNSSTRPYTIW